MRIVLLFFILLLIGAFFIISNNNLHLSVQEERISFFNSYYNWIGSLLVNFKGLVGYVINSPWIPNTGIK